MLTHDNRVYKNLLNLSKLMGAPDAGEIFALSGRTVTNSQLRAWRAGLHHKHYRPTTEADTLNYLNGLIQWQKMQ